MANSGPLVEAQLVSPAWSGVSSTKAGASVGHDSNALFGSTQSVSSGGAADVLEAAWLHDAAINLDPEGSMTLTTDTAANLIADPLAGDIRVARVVLRNAADAAETITLAGGSGVTMRTNEGAADLVIGQDEAAELTFFRTSASAVDCYVTFFT